MIERVSAPRRYVVAGVGHRAGYMFVKPLATDYPETARLAGLFDVREEAMRGARAAVRDEALPCFTDFDAMLRAVNPDAVIVTTPDHTHAEYVVRTLRAGKRAISEKPLCTKAEDIAAIREALKTPGAAGFVSHNIRYTREIMAIRNLVAEGRIGRLLSMTFTEMLDWRHGAYYFRRWHRMRANTGGLLIHKASHHFDFLNWIAGSTPATAAAVGGLAFYGSAGPFRHTRCPGCPHRDRCEFWFDSQGGTIPDLCVYDAAIDIEDHAAVVYTYANGVRCTYTLTTFSPYEGVRFALEGTRGRLELTEFVDTQWSPGRTTVPGLEPFYGSKLVEYLPGAGVREVPLPDVEGGHGGGDVAIRRDLFTHAWDAPPPAALATIEDGAQAVMLGLASSLSIAHGGRLVDVQAQRVA